MSIASITMVGQFPDGVDLHVRNLKWFLRNTDYHIYVITTPSCREQIALVDDKVTFITKPAPHGEFAESPRNPGFINFWKSFPAIIETHRIDAEWFLLMEQDLWFFQQFDEFPPPNTVKTFFAEKQSYHDIMLGDRILQPHLWEGTHLINAAIVRRAIDFKIDFGYRAKSLLDRRREHYEKLFGGPLTISQWSGPETLSDFALYCALEERVGWVHVEKAVHLQGPELLHRKYPKLYARFDKQLAESAQRELPYIDIYAIMALYYIAGVWESIREVEWSNAGQGLRQDLCQLAQTADQWMSAEQYARFLAVIEQLDHAGRSTIHASS